jgi:excisionase family DNA binding protein
MAITETTFPRRNGAPRPARSSPSPSLAQRTDTGTEPNWPGHDAELPCERLAYSVAEAALITGLSRDLLYAQMRTGKLAYLKVGRRRIITRRSLDAFLARPAS